MSMTQENQITLRGYITTEPQFRHTAKAGIPVTELRVGSTPRRLNRDTGEWEDLATSYFTVKCWRRLAINASSSLHKGDRVLIRGHFYLNQWVDSEQRPRERLEIEADSLGHDLSYGWTHFLRGVQQRPGGQAALNAGEAARQDLELPGDGDEGPAGYPGAGVDDYPGERWAGPGDGALVTDSDDGPAAPGLVPEAGEREPAAAPF
jgi:single-strand DNA-binding protein